MAVSILFSEAERARKKPQKKTSCSATGQISAVADKTDLCCCDSTDLCCCDRTDRCCCCCDRTNRCCCDRTDRCCCDRTDLCCGNRTDLWEIPNTPKYPQILPDTPKYSQIPLNTPKYHEILQNTSQISPNTCVALGFLPGSPSRTLPITNKIEKPIYYYLNMYIHIYIYGGFSFVAGSKYVLPSLSTQYPYMGEPIYRGAYIRGPKIYNKNV